MRVMGIFRRWRVDSMDTSASTAATNIAMPKKTHGLASCSNSNSPPCP
jgi:hypothetical protein